MAKDDEVLRLLGELGVSSSDEVTTSVRKIVKFDNRVAQYGPKILETKTYEIVDGIRVAAQDQNDPAKQSAWQYLQFVATICPLVNSTNARRFHSAFDLVSLGLSESNLKHQGVIELGRFSDFHSNSLVPTVGLIDDILCWGRGYWYLAYAFGAYMKTSEELLDMYLRLADNVRAKFPDSASAFGFAAEWIIQYQIRLNELPRLVCALDQIFSNSEIKDERRHAAMFLQGRVGREVHYDRDEAARLALEHPSPQARFQVAVQDWLSDQMTLSQLVTLVMDASNELDTLPGSDASRETLFRSLAPVVLNLTESGRCTDALTVLAALRGVSPPFDDVQILIPFAEMGPTLSLPTGRVSQAAPVNLSEFVESFNEFRQSAVVIRGHQYVEPKSPGRPDLVVSSSGKSSRYAKAVGDLLDAVGMNKDDVAPFTVFPLEPHPFQPILLHLGRPVSPWSVSLQRPLPDAPVRKASIVACDEFMEQLEAAHVKRLLEQDDAAVQFMGPNDCSADRLRRAYEDQSVDLLWLSCHGDFDSRSPEDAHLKVGNDVVRFSDIRSWETPERETRRLLMVNACYGGATPSLEGGGTLGLSTSIAGPSQSVITHLWNSHWLSASTFGVLLASVLKQGHFPAFKQVAKWMLEADKIPSRLEHVEANNLAERVRQNSSVNWDDLSIWGSVAFFQ